MASEVTKNLRAVLLGMLVVAALLVLFGKALSGDDGKPDPDQSTPPEARPIIEVLCDEVRNKVQSISNPGKYTAVCADAKRAWDRDQSETCVAKLKELDQLLKKAKLGYYIPQSAIGQACTPKRIEA